MNSQNLIGWQSQLPTIIINSFNNKFQKYMNIFNRNICDDNMKVLYSV